MKLRRLPAFLLAILLILSMGACKGKDQGNPDTSSSSMPEEEKDPNYPVAIGSDIRIPERPKRVVSLSPALTELICELGAEDRLTGVSDFCDYPPSVENLSRCGTSQLPNKKELKDLKPQVVFASSRLSDADITWLEQMDTAVVVLPRADSIEGISELYVTVGTILDGLEDGERNGERKAAELQKRYDAIARAGESADASLSGIYLKAAPLLMATGDTFEGKLLETIGVKNDAADYTNWSYPADQAVNLYPDLIFYDKSIDPEYFKGTQVYNTTGAYQNGRMYAVDMTAFERQSGRMFDELEAMFRSAWPDLADQLDSGEADAPSDMDSSETESSAPDSEDGMLDAGDATQIVQ